VGADLRAQEKLMTTATDIEAQAMDWIVRLEALPDEAEAQTRAEFTAWCEADSRRHAAYIRLSSAWRKADRLRRLATEDGAVDMDLLAPASAISSADRARRLSGWRLPLVAALAFVAVGAAAWLARDRWFEETYATQVGGFERLMLADGSMVELDTDSRIRVQMSNGRRPVALLRGPAHFKVARDAQRPFEVEAGATIVRALGTAFSLHLRERDRVELLVTEGRVAVLEGVELEEATPVLAAGEAALIQPSQSSVRPVKIGLQDMKRQLSWTQGRLVFEGETLQEAVSELNRYNPRTLVIADPAIANIRVGGSFQPTDPESFVTALERSFGIAVQSADAKEIRLVRAVE
jgi:transmembrane sensor